MMADTDELGARSLVLTIDATAPPTKSAFEAKLREILPQEAGAKVALQLFAPGTPLLEPPSRFTVQITKGTKGEPDIIETKCLLCGTDFSISKDFSRYNRKNQD